MNRPWGQSGSCKVLDCKERSTACKLAPDLTETYQEERQDAGSEAGKPRQNVEVCERVCREERHDDASESRGDRGCREGPGHARRRTRETTLPLQLLQGPGRRGETPPLDLRVRSNADLQVLPLPVIRSRRWNADHRISTGRTRRTGGVRYRH